MLIFPNSLSILSTKLLLDLTFISKYGFMSLCFYGLRKEWAAVDGTKTLFGNIHLNIRQEISLATARCFKAKMLACKFIYLIRIAAVLCTS